MNRAKALSLYLLTAVIGIAGGKMAPDIPWPIVGVCALIACSVWVILTKRSRQDDAPLTKGDLKEQLAANNLELQSIRNAAKKLYMEPLGTEGAEHAPLPEGAKLVKTPDGNIRLALPINLGMSFSGTATGAFKAGITLDKGKDGRPKEDSDQKTEGAEE